MREGSPAHHEILANIDEKDLKTLSEVYRENETNCYATSFLINGMRIKEMVKGYPIRFMSPLRVWKENGTFLAITEFDSAVEVGIFTLQPENTEEGGHDAVFTALTYTKRIHFENTRRPIIFKEVHHALEALLLRILRAKHLKVEKNVQFHVFKLNMDEAMQFEVHLPEDVVLRVLDASSASVIQANWPHYYPTTVDHPRTLLDVNGGYGIFSKKDNQLLSWGLKTMMGQIGMVQTLEKAQRKGYASMIVKTFAREFACEKINPVAIVGLEDAVSHDFFASLGFQNTGVCHNIHLKLKEVGESGSGSGSERSARLPGFRRHRKKSSPSSSRSSD